LALEEILLIEVEDFLLFIFLQKPHRPNPHFAKIAGRCAV
jgi:hypothetical protein